MMRRLALATLLVTMPFIGRATVAPREVAAAPAHTPLLQTVPPTSPVIQGASPVNGHSGLHTDGSSPVVPGLQPGLQTGGVSGPLQQSQGGVGLNGAGVNGTGVGINGLGLNNGVGGGAVRAPGQNCRGFGHCAWGGQSDYTAACTPDARLCTSTGAGPDWPSTRCSANGTLRTCVNDGGSLTIQSGAPGVSSAISPALGATTGNGLNPQLGIGGSGTGGIQTSPRPCISC
jgi:hypothetical protein